MYLLLFTTIEINYIPSAVSDLHSSSSENKKTALSVYFCSLFILKGPKTFTHFFVCIRHKGKKNVNDVLVLTTKDQIRCSKTPLSGFVTIREGNLYNFIFSLECSFPCCPHSTFSRVIGIQYS